MIKSNIFDRIIHKIHSKTKITKVQFGSFRRVTPISPIFGYDRGSQSIARYYIDQFIEANTKDIYGHVLEIGDCTYTKRFGGNHVTKADVLHAEVGNPIATIVADLSKADMIPSNIFDCIIFTQTLQCIYDFHSALSNVARILKPGGTLLVTLSGISQISRFDMDRWGEFWRFTTISAKQLFSEFFHQENLNIRAHGNVLAAIALLQGLASRELAIEELDYHDPDYQVIITVRAVKLDNALNNF